MDCPAFVPIGRVMRTHGLRGEVSVSPASDGNFEFAPDTEVWVVPPPEGVRHTAIRSVRRGPKGPLLTLAGVNDLHTARSLVGADLLVRPEDLPVGWSHDELPDPVGLAVRDGKLGDLGEVREVIVTGTSDVWVLGGGPLGQVLIPVIDTVVLHVDWESRLADVELPPGLVDEREV